MRTNRHIGRLRVRARGGRSRPHRPASGPTDRRPVIDQKRIDGEGTTGQCLHRTVRRRRFDITTDGGSAAASPRPSGGSGAAIDGPPIDATDDPGIRPHRTPPVPVTTNGRATPVAIARRDRVKSAVRMSAAPLRRTGIDRYRRLRTPRRSRKDRPGGLSPPRRHGGTAGAGDSGSTRIRTGVGAAAPREESRATTMVCRKLYPIGEIVAPLGDCADSESSEQTNRSGTNS